MKSHVRDQEILSEMTILIVDDDKKLCQLIADYLEPMGYAVESAYNGTDGLQLLRDGKYDAVILDVMMPGMDGFEVLSQLRRFSDIPVLMLTARGEETDRIVGLEMGADDYLPKTFSSRELLARLRAVTRRYKEPVARAEIEQQNNILKFDMLEIDQDSRNVCMAGKDINLTPIEFELLLILATAKGRVLTRDQLLETIAGRSFDTFDRSVDVHISSLRRKLGEEPRNPTFIQTVRSVGYMFKKSKVTV